jgi:hypothetical protein
MKKDENPEEAKTRANLADVNFHKHIFSSHRYLPSPLCPAFRCVAIFKGISDLFESWWKARIVFLWFWGFIRLAHKKTSRWERKKIFELSSMGHVIYYHHSWLWTISPMWIPSPAAAAALGRFITLLIIKVIYNVGQCSLERFLHNLREICCVPEKLSSKYLSLPRSLLMLLLTDELLRNFS